MNDLFSGSFSRYRENEQDQESHGIEMGDTGGVNLDKFSKMWKLLKTS